VKHELQNAGLFRYIWTQTRSTLSSAYLFMSTYKYVCGQCRDVHGDMYRHFGTFLWLWQKIRAINSAEHTTGNIFVTLAYRFCMKLYQTHFCNYAMCTEKIPDQVYELQ
jgi:hypothetical protein